MAAHLVQGDFYRLEPIASFAWPLLLQAGGLATVDGGRLRLTAKGLAALREPAEDVIRGLWTRWLTHGVIDEFSRIDTIKGQGARNVLTAARPRREIVGQALASCPPDQWVGIDGLFATMRRRRTAPRSSATRGRCGSCTSSMRTTAASVTTAITGGRWSRDRYTLVVLFEYAATLGLVDVEYVDPAVRVMTSATPGAARTWTRSVVTTVCTRSGSRVWAATRSAWLVHSVAAGRRRRRTDTVAKPRRGGHWHDRRG